MSDGTIKLLKQRVRRIADSLATPRARLYGAVRYSFFNAATIRDVRASKNFSNESNP